MEIFIAGVPNLKRSEIQAACEDFSNVIGTSPMGTVYKGTLSSGVEIAVASLAATSAGGWCNNLELQFRKKVLNKLKLYKMCMFHVISQPLIVLMVMVSDRDIIKSEPQEFCQPNWILRGRTTFH